MGLFVYILGIFYSFVYENAVKLLSVWYYADNNKIYNTIYSMRRQHEEKTA
jgi:hypothetical protein